MYNYKKRVKNLSLFPIIQDKEIALDIALYKQILSFRSHSGSETEYQFSCWLFDWFSNNIPEAEIVQDKFGNIYVTKGDAEQYPCIVAHLDINQDEVESVSMIEANGWLLGIDNSTGEQCGLGADDKAGILAIMQLVNKFDIIKCFLPVMEEVGCRGTHAADKQFFTNCTMLLQLDRNAYAGSEFITHTNGSEICSKEFVDAASQIMTRYGFFESDGMYTDVGEIAKFKEVTCIAANICAGYFDEHSDQEVTYLPALENSINFTYEIIKNFGSKKWEFVTEEEKYLRWNETDYIVGTNRHQYNWDDKITPKEDWILGMDYLADRELNYKEAQDELTIGFCPNCAEETVDEDLDGMSWCSSCGSYFNIPVHQEPYEY